jgi:carboxyl-terminal processing protease
MLDKRKWCWVVVLLFCVTLGIWRVQVLHAQADEVFPSLEKLIDCLEIIKNNYVEEVPPSKLIEGAIKGMTETLDPHSAYLTKEAYREMEISLKGSFGGLGIELGESEGNLIVISPIEDSPAFKAGVKPGDRILKIDGRSTVGLSLDEAVSLLRGKKGTKVTLTLTRDTAKKPFDVILTREIIKVESVQSGLLESGYGYIKVRSFKVDTADEIEKALKPLLPLKGLILDLRYDPGGVLNQAIAVSDLFLSEGLIVYTDGRRPDDRQEYSATEKGTYEGFPMVVLINGGTASAAEIVAGALQDNHRAVVVGVKSFGKASVQTIKELPDGSALKLTVARYYTPSGRSIQAKGIQPDIVVEQREPLSDDQTQKFLREEDLKQHLEAADDGQAKPVSPSAMLASDYQLKYALDLIKAWELLAPTKARMNEKATDKAALPN